MSIGELRAAFAKGFKSVFSYFKNLVSRIQELEAEIERLKEIESKYEQLTKDNKKLKSEAKDKENKNSKNSRNSSKPPSSDSPFTKEVKNSRGKSNNKPGGQNGHTGTTLRTFENPDIIEKLKLDTRCQFCKTPFGNIPKEQVTRQIIDLLIQRNIRELQAESVACPCCNKRNTAKFPDYCKKKIQYSPFLKSIVVYLNKYHLIPSKRTKEFLQHVCGISLSEGSIANFSKELSNKTESFEHTVEELLVQSKCMHNDESGARCEKKLHWFHVMSTKYITLFKIHLKRGREAMDDIGVLPRYNGKSVHDFYSSYFLYECEHILCNAHLLRELIYEDEVMGQKWAKDMKKLLLKIKKNVERKKAKGESRLPKSTIKKYETEFNKILLQGLMKNKKQKRDPNSEKKKGKVAQTSSRNLLERLREYQSSYLAFMYDFELPFDNNLAERDIRMLKLYLKISGCFRTQKSAGIFCRIRSYIYTVKKNGLNPLEQIQNAFMSKPFIPKFAE